MLLTPDDLVQVGRSNLAGIHLVGQHSPNFSLPLLPGDDKLKVALRAILHAADWAQSLLNQV